MLLLLSLAFAADLSGVWSLDTAASDPVDAILAASGASWLERQAAGSMSVTQTITQSPERVVLDIDSTFKDRREELVPDGVERETPAKNGTAHTRCFWKDDALVSVSRVPTATGTTIVLTATRTVEDAGRTLRQRLEVVQPDGSVLKADRVYRRR